ncbi:hypothetical protein T265_09346 [Opisthorchis viverrini]|uniref:Uncharacterized protein n=1 Tax=Opisthorchis viverrini TaxID=6198 RepID=A0A074ZH86_OPIVI|nr:hypothetical protein T265_09346 [Opisthorchis viverrini]KER22585.1 hypothetical protein T265_09346 [Opisthorchis viverrini]
MPLHFPSSTLNGHHPIGYLSTTPHAPPFSKQYAQWEFNHLRGELEQEVGDLWFTNCAMHVLLSSMSYRVDKITDKTSNVTSSIVHVHQRPKSELPNYAQGCVASSEGSSGPGSIL